MSWMTEKKARELLELYKKAERSAGQEDQAEAIEKQLNDAGWQITMGPEGETIKRIEKEGGVLDTWFLPKDSNITPYQGSSRTETNPGANSKAIWISIGIGVAVIGIIALIVYLAKRRKNVAIR